MRIRVSTGKMGGAILFLLSVGAMYGMWIVDTGVFSTLVSQTGFGGGVGWGIVFLICLGVSLFIFFFGIVGTLFGLIGIVT